MPLITYLVEDNEIVLENLVEALREIASVEVTGHGATQAEASQWLSMHNGEWHLAIVDLFLKEGNGLGVLAGCRNRESYQKVVVLTNYATDEIRRRAADLGADAVFDKSSELDDLFAYCGEQTLHEAEPEIRQAQHAARMRRRAAAAVPARRGTPGSQG
jgi:two-component system, OmpR family, response regulator